MATRYVQQATKQIAPAYKQQIQALQGQVAPLQQLYESLYQGLGGMQQQGNQQILEDASARGVLRSTMPVYDQGVLGGQILQQQGKYASDYAKEYGALQERIAGARVGQAEAVAQLAQVLQQSALAQQQFNYQKQLGNRQYQLALQSAQRGF